MIGTKKISNGATVGAYKIVLNAALATNFAKKTVNIKLMVFDKSSSTNYQISIDVSAIPEVVVVVSNSSTQSTNTS